MSFASEIVQPVSQLTAQSVSWLWQGRLAVGRTSIGDGDPEIGKSLVTLDLSARVSTGRPFPDGTGGGEPRNVVILNGEDTEEDSVAPRLRALGADLDRVFVFKKEYLDQVGPLCLPTHSLVLERAVRETRAALAILDPLTAFLHPSVQISVDTSVRRALAPLRTLARCHGCHVMAVRHLNKSGHFRSMYRGGGSIGILAACRSAFLFARDPFDPLCVVMAHLKNNDAPRAPSLTYRIVAHGSGFPIVEWLGESPHTADQLLAFAGRKPALPGARDRARDFLFAFLDEGPKTTLEIWPAATRIGLSKRTLQHVSRKMKIRAETVWNGTRTVTYWLLENQQLPPGIVPPKPSLEPWLAPLREKYPTTPLDDDT
jgi:hypothetical protein